MDNLMINKVVRDLQPLGENFISYLDIRSQSANTYNIALKQFFTWSTINNIKEPTREDIISYREDLKKRVKPNTTQGYLIALRQFFKWTSMLGLYPNICDNVKGVQVDNIHKKDALTIDQARQVIESISNVRDYALISLLMVCGLRTIEVERANIEDIRTIGDMKVLFVQGKGRDEKAEYVKLPEQVYNALDKYIKSRTDSCNALFVSESNRSIGGRMPTRSIRYIVKHYFRDNGLNSDRLSSHSLRHTSATLALICGSTIQEVQQMLRHQKLDTTLIYAHNLERINNTSENNVAKAIFGH